MFEALKFPAAYIVQSRAFPCILPFPHRLKGTLMADNLCKMQWKQHLTKAGFWKICDNLGILAVTSYLDCSDADTGEFSQNYFLAWFSELLIHQELDPGSSLCSLSLVLSFSLETGISDQPLLLSCQCNTLALSPSSTSKRRNLSSLKSDAIFKTCELCSDRFHSLQVSGVVFPVCANASVSMHVSRFQVLHQISRCEEIVEENVPIII